MNAIQTLWLRLDVRERVGVTLASGALILSALWWLALAPALHTVSEAPAQKARLQAQAQVMQQQAVQAKALQGQPKLGREEAVRALEETVRQRLGTAGQFSLQGDRALVVLKGCSAQALAQWLSAARVQARLVPTEAHLQRSPATATAAASADLWDGTLVLTLPTPNSSR